VTLKKTFDSVINERLVRYVVAGGSAFVAEYSSFIILFYILKWAPVYANTLSFVLGLATSFTLNKFWVFGKDSQQRQSHHQFVMYSVLALINLIITNIAIDHLIKSGVPAFVAKIVLIMSVACWNFLIFKKIIFKSAESTKA
jgi:putative flippase GtrA